MADGAIPTQEEIQRLPRWARVAFAARCARRAQPFFVEAWPNPHERHLTAVEQAISVAERTNAYAAAYAAYTASRAADARATAAEAAAYAAEAAAYAIAADARATSAKAADANAAAIAVSRAAAAGVPRQLIRADFTKLLRLATEQNWTDDTPVSPSVFEPLPPSPSAAEVEPKPPEPLPTDTESFDLLLKLYVRDGVDPQDARVALRSLYNAMNDYSIMKWGKGLTIRDFQQHVLAGVPAGVLS